MPLVYLQMQRSVAVHTLGCKLNYSESSAISRLMQNEGFVTKEFDELADVYVINTCSVTDNADKECRQLVRRIQRKAPASIVVVTGCYAQLKPEQIAAIDGVDLVLGAAEKFNITRHLQDLTKGDATKICSCDIEDISGFHPSFSMNDRTRSFLKVQDGCDYICSFCTIPMARGKSRSNTIDKVVDEVRQLAAAGVKETVLTGINLGDFGKDAAGKRTAGNFLSLARALDEIDEMPRIRISSIEPNLLSTEIIDFVAGSRRFMPHFHIPLQSGSNSILAAMRRRYRKELYADRVAYIKEKMPHCCIGSDVIVGFPGESDTDFRETFDFLHGADVSYLHVFTYSERDHTHALDLGPVVPMNTRHERNRQFRNLSFQKMNYFNRQHAGEKRPVLFEGKKENGMMEGYTDNYIRITTPYRSEWENTITEWTI